MEPLAILQLAAAGCNINSLGWAILQNAIYRICCGAPQFCHIHEELTDEVLAREVEKDNALRFSCLLWERA